MFKFIFYRNGKAFVLSTFNVCDCPNQIYTSKLEGNKWRKNIERIKKAALFLVTQKGAQICIVSAVQKEFVNFHDLSTKRTSTTVYQGPMIHLSQVTQCGK